ncbi:MAG: FtsX-like permease family protein, partial [bacterium]|nr:FtsX-like permease family protein [bacterium]
MLKNYLKIVFRNIIKNRFYSLVNILGLSVGMAIFILVGMYFVYELSYDGFHKQADNIYRVVRHVSSESGGVNKEALCPGPLSIALEEEFPSIVKTARIFNCYSARISVAYKDKKIMTPRFYFVDADFFNIFDAGVIAGDPAAALKEPYSVVMTESAARVHFGDEDPMGKVLEIFDGKSFTVKGIIKDMPRNSHLNINILTSFANLKGTSWSRRVHSWGMGSFCYTYVLLEEGVSAGFIDSKFPDFCKKYIPADRKASVSYSLQPLRDIHLGTPAELELRRPGNLALNFLFLGIGLFILIIAVINYVNSTTVYYGIRFKEIGVRKMLGAGRFQLVRQFIGESVTLCFLAIGCSFVLMEFMLPLFNRMVGRYFSLSLLFNVEVLVLLFLFSIVVGIAAGAYPAFYVSRLQTTRILKGASGIDMKSGPTRKILITLQLVIISFLIIGSAMVHNQLTNLYTHDVKFDKENLIALYANKTPLLHSHYDAFINDVTKDPNVLGATAANVSVGMGAHKELFSVAGFRGKKFRQLFAMFVVRHGF